MNTQDPSDIPQFSIEPIGLIHSPYKQKFGIPRQPGLAKHAMGIIEIYSKYSRPEAFEGIEQFSHLWIEFYFHQTAESEWKPSVRPPRLGGNKKTGCFATRSNFRPNNMGLSVVKFEKVELDGGNIRLHISGHDLLDQTPILDIKPYIPYSDALPDAHAGHFEHAPSDTLDVCFSETVLEQIRVLSEQHSHLKHLIKEVLEQDPRPAYMKQKANRDEFAVQLFELDIKWRVENNTAHVIDIIPLK